MKNKVISIDNAVKLVKDGDMIAFGGNVLHRAPMAFAREIIRNEIGNLKVVKTAGAHEVDILCGANLVQSVDAGFISYESEFGLANFYRRGVQDGVIKGNEHACYTVISALRAAAYGVPFMPVKGLMYGDLLVKNDYFKMVQDPFSGEPITLVQSLNPDVCVIHVQKCDASGNSFIYGPKFDDVLMTRASKKVIITTEEIISSDEVRKNNMNVDIPGMLVDAVVHVPKGAVPCSCYSKYEINKNILSQFMKFKTKDEVLAYVKAFENQDRMGACV